MTPMKNAIPNQQEVLAEQFHINDIQISHTSYEAVLKIKRWKFISKIPGIGKRIIKEADGNLERTLLNYISNTSVLIEEGYYFSSNEN